MAVMAWKKTTTKKHSAAESGVNLNGKAAALSHWLNIIDSANRARARP